MDFDLLHPLSLLAVAAFVIAYILVVMEEKIHLRKSKPVMFAAGVIWLLVAIYATSQGDEAVHAMEHAAEEYLLEYVELFLFLLVAMAYINTMQERGLFDALRVWMINQHLGYRGLFWLTGIVAFFLSAIADNLTTALVMCAIVLSVGRDNPKFIPIACVNIVISANAGGAFSPFGDITTLMVWQAGHVEFIEFFALFFPSLVNWLVPAVLMFWFVPKTKPLVTGETIHMEKGARRSAFLFVLTIITAVSFHTFLHLPPAMGMMTGLAYLTLFGFYLRKRLEKQHIRRLIAEGKEPELGEVLPWDVFKKVARAEWDTLLFFYGIILCVGGLAFLGYLTILSDVLYDGLGGTGANIMVGILSAIIDNIPMMVAVLQMMTSEAAQATAGAAEGLKLMSLDQWLLVTLTAGTGGSLLAIGSAAGVALMGASKGHYTFFQHLKWTPFIALGYFLSVGVHLLINT